MGGAEVELLRHDFVQVFRVLSAAQTLGGTERVALRLYGPPDATRKPDGEEAPGTAPRSPGVLRSQLLWPSFLYLPLFTRVL